NLTQKSGFAGSSQASAGRPLGLPLASQELRLPSPTSSSPWSYTCASGNDRRPDTTCHGNSGERTYDTGRSETGSGHSRISRFEMHVVEMGARWAPTLRLA